VAARVASVWRTAAILAAVAAAMLGASFAAVPLYKLFCQVTGYGGATQVAAAAPRAVLDREITVRLDSNVAPGLPIAFRPEKISHRVKFGQTAIAYYDVTNTSDRPVQAVASYNVSPHKMGSYFQKLECFCFEDQTFQPGEARQLAVIFFVDPEAAADWDTREVQTLTLSYTFYESARMQTAQSSAARQP